LRNANRRGLCRIDLDVGVTVPPDKWKTREPVLPIDAAAGASEFLRREESRRRSKFWPRDFSADRARRNLDPRIVADTLAFPKFTVGHEIEFFIIFREPDGGIDSNSIPAKGRKADITLASNLARDRRHFDIVERLAILYSLIPPRPAKPISGRYECQGFLRIPIAV